MGPFAFEGNRLMQKRNLVISAMTCAIPLIVSGLAAAQASDGAYRGRIVCEKIAIARDIVNVPFDLIVRGQTGSLHGRCLT